MSNPPCNCDKPGWFMLAFVAVLCATCSENTVRRELLHHHHVGDSVVVDSAYREGANGK